MKNVSSFAAQALRVRLALSARRPVGEALSAYAPVGWSAAGYRPDGGLWQAAGGEARIGESLAEPATIFRVASVSKVLGAASAMRLVREGKLSLDGPVSDVLRFETEKPITLRQLLTHTAALCDARAYDAAIMMDALPPLPDVVRDSFLPYAPGTRFRYSNLGAGIVGMMVEAASGMLFDDYVRAAFFTPHGIDASFHPQRIVNKARMANCYRVPGRALRYNAQSIAALPLDDVPDPMRHYQVPAGKLMISAPDLLSVLRRLAVDMPEMFVHQNYAGSVRTDAVRGLGVSYAPAGVFSRSRAMWGHQGVAYGALCEAWIDLSDGTAAVLLTNGVRLAAIGPLYLAGQSGIRAILDR